MSVCIYVNPTSVQVDFTGRRIREIRIRKIQITWHIFTLVCVYIKIIKISINTHNVTYINSKTT